MLRYFFPSTVIGAQLYNGFMSDENTFFKLFDQKNDLKKSFLEINNFLDQNGYESISFEEFEMIDETNSFEKHPIVISKHAYQNQYILTILKDVFSKSQSNFIISELKKFRDERDWNQFHNPKDIAIALSIESNEILEQFLWKSADEAKIENVKEELADVFAYAFLLADKYNFNIEEIILEKIKRNGEKYPVEKAKGTAKKYTEL